MQLLSEYNNQRDHRLEIEKGKPFFTQHDALNGNNFLGKGSAESTARSHLF